MQKLDYTVKIKTIHLDNDKSTKMEKTLLCQLSNNSPTTSDTQRKPFHKIVNKDEAIKAIVSVVIGMDTSVEFIKNIMMDNCGS